MEVSGDVWLNQIVPYCGFTTLISLTQLNSFFHQHLSRDESWTERCKSHFRHQLALVPSEYETFHQSIWLEDDSSPDQRRISMNKLIYMATSRNYEPFLLLQSQSPIQRHTLTSILTSCYPACQLTPLLFFLKLIERFYPEWGQHKVNSADLSPIRICTLIIINRWVAQSLVPDFQRYYPDDYKYLLIEIVQPFLFTWGIRYKSMGAAQNNLVEWWAKLHEPKKTNQINEPTTSLLNCSVEEIAKVLTLRGALNRSRLTPTEFVNQNWSRPKKRMLAPNIMAFINDYNRICEWVTLSILSFDDKTERVNCLEKMIDLAHTLDAQQDYNSCKAIVGGIESVAVHRLQHTWAQVSTSMRQKYDKTQRNMMSDKGFQTLRYLSSNNIPECIPYMGMYLTDLTFIEDGSSSPDPKYLNLRKLCMVHSVIGEFMNRAEHPILSECNSDEINRCVHLFEKSVYDLQFDIATTYQRSQQLEPRARKAV